MAYIDSANIKGTLYELQDTQARAGVAQNTTDIADLKSAVGAFEFLYTSPNVFDYTNSSMILEDKVISSNGAISNNSTYNVLKIPVNGIDGNAYQLYYKNSQGNMLVPKTTRWSMLASDGTTTLGLLINNTPNPAIINNADCKYLACYITKADYGKGTDIMVLINAFGTLLHLYEYIPYDISPKKKTPWYGKTWAAYGDSITAISNASGSFPYMGWAKYVNEQNGITAFYGRGIGGQKFIWGTNGGSACFIKTDSGEYDSRNDNYNKDNYSGSVPTGCTLTRGAFCSWDRITHMFPSSIKDTINMVFIMGSTNDYDDETDLVWLANDTTDTEWAASSQYSTYGGDYNITTLRGGIASTVMKMQAWMPNATIIIGTPLNGQTGIAEGIKPETLPDEYEKSIAIKEIASKFACPVIDVFGTCGINVLNSPEYITDGTHPYSEAGCAALGRAINMGLAVIMPKSV